jgi:hypothetical protein
MNTIHRYRLLLPLTLIVMSLAACQPQAPDTSDYVRVTGVGNVTVQPDHAIMRLGVEIRDRELPAAREQAERRLASTRDQLQALGIENSDIVSTAILSQPEYRYDEGERRLVGYLVSRTLEVTVRDLALLGKLADIATASGMNTLGTAEFAVSNSREHYREALQRAANDARSNAEILASTLQRNVGKVTTIDESVREDMQPYPPMEQAFQMRADTASTPTELAVGEIRFEANVSARFKLVD